MTLGAVRGEVVADYLCVAAGAGGIDAHAPLPGKRFPPTSTRPRPDRAPERKSIRHSRQMSCTHAAALAWVPGRYGYRHTNQAPISRAAVLLSSRLQCGNPWAGSVTRPAALGPSRGQRSLVEFVLAQPCPHVNPTAHASVADAAETELSHPSGNGAASFATAPRHVDAPPSRSLKTRRQDGERRDQANGPYPRLTHGDMTHEGADNSPWFVRLGDPAPA